MLSINLKMAMPILKVNGRSKIDRILSTSLRRLEDFWFFLFFIKNLSKLPISTIADSCHA